MKIKKPDFKLIDLYDICVSHYKDKEKEKLMKQIKNDLINDESRYLKNLDDGKLYLEREGITHSKDVSKSDLIDLYNRKLINSQLEARSYYDRIRTSSHICPYCGKRHVTTVDHFMPKSIYPNFSITPINLIPCCSDCNTSKNDEKYDTEDSIFFHPYSNDEINNKRWLIAKLILKDGYLMFDFNVSDNQLDSIEFSRMNNQFKKLKLKEYYNVEANEKFNSYCKGYYNQVRGNNEEGLLNFFLWHKEMLDDINSFDFVYFSTLIDEFDVVLDYLQNYYNPKDNRK